MHGEIRPIRRRKLACGLGDHAFDAVAGIGRLSPWLVRKLAHARFLTEFDVVERGRNTRSDGLSGSLPVGVVQRFVDQAGPPQVMQ